jgi:hypothetical protein
MKILVEFELKIEGDCSEETVRENFIEWFQPSPKVSPEEHDDDFQVWIHSLTVKEDTCQST